MKRINLISAHYILEKHYIQQCMTHRSSEGVIYYLSTIDQIGEPEERDITPLDNYNSTIYIVQK